MLDDRKAAILRAVVQEYIETAQPVGSGRVKDAASVGVSAATVRNDMANLEELGYLVQPHTSAGRIPTDQGYRFFVDNLNRNNQLPAGDRRRVRDFFDTTHHELESMLSHTSELLSNLTDWTAVVVAPVSDSAVVRSVQVVDVSSHTALVVAVLSSGTIEKRAIEVAVELTAEVATAAGERLDKAIVGKTLTSLVEVDSEDERYPTDVDGLANAAIAALAAAGTAGGVYVGGASRVAAAFDAVEQVRDVLSILEKQLVVVTVIRDVLDRGLRVAIGEETGDVSLADCSLVVAPYAIDGTNVGTIGVLGPTRMDYSQALSAVAAVSSRLGEVLTDG